MLDADLLLKLDTPSEYIPLILAQNAIYGEQIEKIAGEYMLSRDYEAMVPYSPDFPRPKVREVVNAYLDRVKSIHSDEKTQYMLMYLFWLHCVPYARRYYQLLGLDEEVFYTSMKDLTYKLQECVNVRGAIGVFTSFFFLQFDMKLFGLGRLQYEIVEFTYDPYRAGNYELKKGDVVYSCHIPSSGPLTLDLCMDSFQKAYQFFKKDLKGTVIPILVTSWLLYPPYQGTTFPEGFNIHRFYQLFDIIDEIHTPKFDDCWRIFNQYDYSDLQNLPAETSMQRRFAEYIASGGSFGYGTGILLYDGEQQKIINQKF